eukprot:gene7685-biopygen9515
MASAFWQGEGRADNRRTTLDPAKQEALLEACNAGDEALLRSLLAEGGVLLDAADVEGWTALHWSIAHPTVVKLLLTEADAQVDARDRAGKTALHWACQDGHDATVSVLLAAGAAVNAVDNDGWTPLAWSHARPSTLQLMISAGGVVDAADKFGKTPLHWACQDGYVASVRLLLDSGSRAISTADLEGLTPLHWASHTGREQVVQLLLQRLGQPAAAAAIDIPDCQHQTPLHWAAAFNHKGVVKLLLDACREHSTMAAGAGPAAAAAAATDLGSGSGSCLFQLGAVTKLRRETIFAAAQAAGALGNYEVFCMLAVEVAKLDSALVPTLLEGDTAPPAAQAFSSIVAWSLAHQQHLQQQFEEVKMQQQQLQQQRVDLATARLGLQHLIVQSAGVVKHALQQQQQQQDIQKLQQQQQQEHSVGTSSNSSNFDNRASNGSFGVVATAAPAVAAGSNNNTRDLGSSDRSTSNSSPVLVSTSIIIPDS